MPKIAPPTPWPDSRHRVNAPANPPPPPSAVHPPGSGARRVRGLLPPDGLFADLHWRLGDTPFPLEEPLAREIDSLGRVLLQFYRAVNLLYRRSVEGKAPAWVAAWLDQGKPPELIALQRDPAFRNDLPRVIRPDILITDDGVAISELDSVPGGIGLTTWLYDAYETVARESATAPDTAQSPPPPAPAWLGSSRAMIEGFSGIFGPAGRVHVVVSEESATYRPEMRWLANRIQDRQVRVENGEFATVAEGDAVYRFFELFDLAQVPASGPLFEAARTGRIRLTPPPRPIFEEKALFALLWNRHLAGYWRQELGAGFFQRLRRMVPYTWWMDPAPLPPHAALPELGLTDWNQLKELSQRERDLILKASGFSPDAWGARSVALGSDLSSTEWAAAVDAALAAWPRSPRILQRYHKPRLVEAAWWDPVRETVVPMPGRVRLCPYYFVHGDGDAARPRLGGVLATICPADKKILHGMQDAILAPCMVRPSGAA